VVVNIIHDYPMKELNRTDRLTIASILFAIILVIGLLTIKKPAMQFTRSIDETLGLITSSGDIITAKELRTGAVVSSGNLLLVDLRSPVDYQKSHIDGAVNIPIQDILDLQNLENFEKPGEGSKIVVLYGNGQVDANSAWLILKQLGYDNVKVLSGGYEYYMTLATDQGNAENAEFMVENPIVNYSDELKKLGTTSVTSGEKKPEAVKIIKREKKTAAEGGC
jgi:rhodanese-related sulfurtransferase